MIMHPYALEYQVYDSIIWYNNHIIISYGKLMKYPYNLLIPNQPMTIWCYTYLHWYHVPHIRSYRIRLQHCHYHNLLQTNLQTTVDCQPISSQFNNSCRIFVSHSGCLTCTSLPKDPQLGYVIYWYWVPSGQKLSIKTSIHQLLLL